MHGRTDSRVPRLAVFGAVGSSHIWVPLLAVFGAVVACKLLVLLRHYCA